MRGDKERPAALRAEDEGIARRLRELATDGRIPCARAFALARELGVPLRRVGEVADGIGVRITACQLGCF